MASDSSEESEMESDSSEESEEESGCDSESAQESLEESVCDSEGAPASKRLRSQEPDVTVVVGSGDDKESFECYSVVLCFASEVFDVMLSTEMKEKNSREIRLPNKKPSEWKLFYKFVDPASMSDPEVHIIDSLSKNVGNVKKLLPWFEEFAMDKWLQKCDRLLSSHFSQTLSGMRYISCKKFKKTLPAIFQGLEKAKLYRLPLTEETLFTNLGTAFRERIGDIDEEIIAEIEPFVHLDGFEKYSWNSIKGFIPEKMQEEDPKDLFNNEMFPSLLMSRIEMAKAKQEAKERVCKESELRAQRRDMKQLGRNLCDGLYDALPNRKVAPMKVNMLAKRKLKEVLEEQGICI